MHSSIFDEAMSAYDDGLLLRAITLMEQCARSGDPVACFLVALWYREGSESKENLDASDAWLLRLRQLAVDGNAAAQWELGQHYRFGNLYPVDVDEANRLLERAAHGHNADAQFHLSCFLQAGSFGFTQDVASASHWFDRALEQGHPEATYMYALAHFVDGRPTENAIQLLRASADKGFRQAQYILQGLLQ